MVDDLYAHLKTLGISGSIYHSVIPEGKPLPAVSFELISSEEERGFGGLYDDRPTERVYFFNIVSDDRKEAERIVSQYYEALHHTYAVSGGHKFYSYVESLRDGYSDKQGVYLRHMQVRFRITKT